MKTRLLIVNEFSQLATGFSTYMQYLLPKLYETGKYEICELALYVDETNPLVDSVPWEVVPNVPSPTDQRGWIEYKKVPVNQFGAWKFEETCLKFKPDVVLTIADPWMSPDFILKSPLRKHYKVVYMPTCDGEPQKKEWLDSYLQADKLLTYSLWAKNLIEQQSGGLISVSDVASPCPDTNVFYPRNKADIRDKYGLSNELFIFGTVMRNQPRKLFPEILRGFNKYLELCEKANRKDLVDKSFLHFHTSFPDVGWDIEQELLNHQLSHKVLFTYLCANCKFTWLSMFNGQVCPCKNCGHNTGKAPNTMEGVSKATLAELMSLSNVYIQYSTNEGFGMPQLDAKALGVPILATDYSAMSEIARVGGGLPIKIQKMFQEPLQQTSQLRALPDNDDLAKKMFSLSSNPELCKKLSAEAVKSVEQIYNWDLVTKVWISAIDNVFNPTKDRPTWYQEPQLRPTQFPPTPNNLNDYQFVQYCYEALLDDPMGFRSKMAEKMVVALTLGYEIIEDGNGNSQRARVDRNIILQNIAHQINQKNQMEMYRYNYVHGHLGSNKVLTEV